MTGKRVGVVATEPSTRLIARRLVDRFRVVVHDPTGADDVAGVVNVALPADAAQAAEIVVIDLNDPAAFEDAVFVLGGVCDTLPSGACVLDLSPHLPSTSRAVKHRLSRFEINYVEAVLLGPLQPGWNEPPLMLVAGTSSDVAAVQPVLGALGVALITTGSPGQAQEARLVLEDAYEMAFESLRNASRDERRFCLRDIVVDRGTAMGALDLIGCRVVDQTCSSVDQYAANAEEAEAAA